MKLHSDKYISDSLQIARNMIVVTVFLFLREQTEVRLVHNQKENCHSDHIPLNLKRIRNIFVWVLEILCFKKARKKTFLLVIVTQVNWCINPPMAISVLHIKCNHYFPDFFLKTYVYNRLANLCNYVDIFFFVFYYGDLNLIIWNYV